MSLLEYADRTVPDIVKKSVPAFYNDDPMFKQLRSRGRIVRSGGSSVRVLRIKSGHSDATEIDGANIQVDLTKRDTTSAMSGDWGKYIKPIVLPHYDIDRMASAEDKARYVKDTTMAASLSMFNDVIQRIYVADRTGKNAFLACGTLNGNKSNGSKSGFTNGALRLQSPTAQAAAAVTYLNETRVEDTTRYEDNWYNQYKQHGGIGTNALRAIEEVKATADSFAQGGDGITIGILSIADFILLCDEIRSYPGGGGQSAVIYTAEDLEKGRVHKQIQQAAGIQFHANRWMTAARVGSTGVIWLLNPDGIEWWVNAGHDFKVSKFVDFLKTTGQDADVGFISLEAQFAVPGLLMCGAVSA